MISDNLTIFSYNQHETEPSFYDIGQRTQKAAIDKIFANHKWSPFHDLGWDVDEIPLGGCTSTEGIRLTPDPDKFNSERYVFNDLREYRAGWWDGDLWRINTNYTLKILDLQQTGVWTSKVHWNLKWTPRQNGWNPASRALTNMLRFEGCKWKRHTRAIPCDTGGWFPIKDILGRNLGGLTANMGLLLNLVYHDEKGRFQIAGEVDQQDFVYDYFAIRATSGHGIPWLEPLRLACPIMPKDLDEFGCITHVTRQQALAGIFRLGLIPGGTFEENNQSETNFGLYFPQ